MKKNNYNSPEVVIVEFELERGFNSSYTAGKMGYRTDEGRLTPYVSEQGTEDFTYETSSWTVSQ